MLLLLVTETPRAYALRSSGVRLGSRDPPCATTGERISLLSLNGSTVQHSTGNDRALGRLTPAGWTLAPFS